jgi:hypothetical protein
VSRNGLEDFPTPTSVYAGRAKTLTPSPSHAAGATERARRCDPPQGPPVLVEPLGKRRPAGLPHGDAVEVLARPAPATWYRPTRRVLPPPRLLIPHLPTRSLQGGLAHPPGTSTRVSVRGCSADAPRRTLRRVRVRFPWIQPSPSSCAFAFSQSETPRGQGWADRSRRRVRRARRNGALAVTRRDSEGVVHAGRRRRDPSPRYTEFWRAVNPFRAFVEQLAHHRVDRARNGDREQGADQPQHGASAEHGD